MRGIRRTGGSVSLLYWNVAMINEGLPVALAGLPWLNDVIISPRSTNIFNTFNFYGSGLCLQMMS